MNLKKIVGYGLIVSPIVGLFAAMVAIDGWPFALSVVGTVFLVIFTVYLGAYLVEKS